MSEGQLQLSQTGVKKYIRVCAQERQQVRKHIPSNDPP